MWIPLLLAASIATTTPIPETVDVTQPALDSATVAESTAVAIPPSPAPRDYMAEMRANFTPETRTYWGTRVALAFLEPLAAMLIGALVLFSGLAAKLRDVAMVLGRSRWVQVLVVLVLFT